MYVIYTLLFVNLVVTKFLKDASAYFETPSHFDRTLHRNICLRKRDRLIGSHSGCPVLNNSDE